MLRCLCLENGIHLTYPEDLVLTLSLLNQIKAPAILLEIFNMIINLLITFCKVNDRISM